MQSKLLAKKYKGAGIVSRHFYTFVITILLTVYVIISYVGMNYSLKDIRQDISTQVQHAENEVVSAIINSNNILYGLATSISKLSAKKDYNAIYRMVQNFDSSHRDLRGIPFSSLVVVDKEYNSIASSITPRHNFRCINFKSAKCLLGTREDPYKLKIGSVSTGIYSNLKIIPLGIAFTNREGEYEGAICSGLVVDNLNQRLLDKAHKELISNIELASLDNINSTNNFEKELRNKITLSNVFTSTIRGKKIELSKKILFYNYIINTQLKAKYIFLELLTGLLDKMIIFLVSIFVVWSLILHWKKRYLAPLEKMRAKLLSISEEMKDKIELHGQKNAYANTDIENILGDYAKVIEWTESRLQEVKEKEVSASLNELKKKFLYMQLIEKHYAPQKNLQNYDSCLNNTIAIMAANRAVNISLEELITQAAEYCVNTYDADIKIGKLLSGTEGFKCYYVPFFESICSIVRFISESCLFDIDSNSILIKGECKDSQKLTIEIEAILLEQNLVRPSTWEDYPSYSFMILYSTILLAQQNMMVLDIKQDGKKLSFILKKIDKVDSDN